MKIRIAQAADTENIVRWSFANSAANDLDPDVFSYPLTEIFCAENGKTVGFLPVQLVAMMESFAPNPIADKGEQNLALYELTDAVAETAAKHGIKEVYFVGSDSETNDFAERLGFEKLTLPVYRLKVGK